MGFARKSRSRLRLHPRRGRHIKFDFAWKFLGLSRVTARCFIGAARTSPPLPAFREFCAAVAPFCKLLTK
jgi:hypothetical protein